MLDLSFYWVTITTIFLSSNVSFLTENITFWETFKPFLTDKTINTFRITLIEEERVISQDHLTTKKFSEYFISIPMKSMPKTQEHESFDSPEEDPASSTIKNMETTQVLS